jgi:ribosomal-protein-alanine N-acetyltransferase
MIEPLKKTPFSHSLRHKRVVLNFANADFTEKLWKTIEQDKKDRDAIWDWIKKIDDVGQYLTDSSKENPGQEVVFIISTDDAPCIGTLHLHTISHWNHKLELGYWIAKKFEGKGFASEAIQCVEEEIKKQGFHRIEIKCNADNIRSVNLANKNGFVLEGTGKQDCVENGLFRDTCHFGKIL